MKKKKNRDERQLTKSRCMAAPPFQKVKNIYIYIHYIYIYIYSEKKEKKKRRKIGFEVSPTGRIKVLPVGLSKKGAVAKSYR